MRSSILVLLATVVLAPPQATSLTPKLPVVRYQNAVIHGESGREFWVKGGARIPAQSKWDVTVDLNGGYVVFGLTDAHGHLLSLGRSMSVIDLVGTHSLAEIVAKVSASAPASGWIEGRGWDQNDWESKAFPVHDLLTLAFPDRPVVLTRIDGHAVVANAAAMTAAGISASSADPPGGQIQRDAVGNPTGVFIDAAMTLLTHAVPAPSREQRLRWLESAFDRLISVGLTAVHDMGADAETVKLLRELDAEGKVPIRVTIYTDGFLPEVPKPGAGRLVNVVGVKLFADGALGSRGAALLEPYSDEPTSSGLFQFDKGGDSLVQAVTRSRRSGFQVAIHAIGDKAVRASLDALHSHGRRSRRPDRIEHAQVIHEHDLPRFAQEGVVASMQPTHQTSDMPWAEARLGPKRVLGAYAWRSLFQSGATVVFGTDFPVESPDPRLTLQAAVTRQTPAGTPEGGWYPSQRVSFEEALAAMTTVPRKLVGADSEAADFTVFAVDLRTVAPSEWPTVRFTHVFVGGTERLTGPKRRSAQ